MKVEGQQKEVDVKDQATWAGLRVAAQRRVYRGAPTIFVNGKPIHGGAVLSKETPDGFFAGVYGPPSFRNAEPEILMPFCYGIQVGENDNTEIQTLEQSFDKLFAEHPKALGGCVLALQPSMDWVRAYPDEMPLYDRPVDWNKVSLRDAGWASEVWRKDSAGFLEKLCRHLHRVFSGRIILYQVGAGACGENFPIAHLYGDANWFCGDFSRPMLAYFRRSLKERYQRDISRMRRAWGDPAVTFANAMPPDRMERMRTEWFALRSPCRCQTADYYRAWSETVEDCTLIWAEAVKRATNNESLTAAPMASVLDNGLNSFLVHHLMKNTFTRAVASPHLDMCQSPASYALRDPGRGDTSAMIPLGMLRLAGKIWLRDFDTRTSLTAKSNEDCPVSSLWRTPRTNWEDVQILKRDTAYSLIKGGAFWWHEIGDGMFKLPEHVRTAKRFQAIGRGIVHADRSTAPGLAVFCDNESDFHQANSNRLIYAMNYAARRLHWSHAGMACEIYHLDNANHTSMPNHKVLMVTNAFCMTYMQAQAIIALARRNAASVIWLMAPGVQSPNGFDLKRTSRITGFRIRSVDIEALPHVVLTPGNHPWSRPHLADGKELGVFGAGLHESDDSGARCIGPLFYADVTGNKDATVLGTLAAINEPGLVVKQMDGWTSVYCAAPYLHNALLRLIGKDTGAHVYVDSDDLVHVAAELLLVHAQRAGTKRIHWPAVVETALDLMTGREIARNRSEWSLEMKEHETHFLFAGSRSTAREVCLGMRKGLTVWE